MDCVFCKIVKNEIASRIIYEDAIVKVFEDIKPSAPVHYLIVPKVHITSFNDLHDGEKDLITHIVFTAQRCARNAHLAGYRLVVNVGREGGQIVDHLHVHLLGGWKEGSTHCDVMSKRIVDK